MAGNSAPRCSEKALVSEEDVRSRLELLAHSLSSAKGREKPCLILLHVLLVLVQDVVILLEKLRHGASATHS